jgi:beta-N-acetylhexosaminidase
VENIGSLKYGLTHAQLKANIALVRYLKAKYTSITDMIGHHEYRKMEGTELWLEMDEGYRTTKNDPGAKFMTDVRKSVVDLNLSAPKK